MDNKTEYTFKSSLISRVRNFSLTPNEKNSLMPIFEAITNSLQSLYEAYDKDWLNKGFVNILLYLDQEGKYPKDIEIEDNGIGFNKVNFDSFLTFDSTHKLEIGGKGIGRFSWLKVFESAHIISTFIENDIKYKREFDFVLNDTPIQNHSLIQVSDNEPIRTIITLKCMKSEYRSRFPNQMETVIKKVLIHFLPSLITVSPSINILSENQDSSDIKEVFSNNSFNLQEQVIETEKYGTLYLKNMFLDKKCLDTKQGHTLFLSANNRIVTDHKLSNQLGLLTNCVYEDHSVFYTGVVTGKYLDEAVFGERSSLNLPEEVQNDIFKIVIDKLKKGYLEQQIKDLLDTKTKSIERIVKKYPRFSYMIKNPQEWAGKLALSSQKDEDIVKELSVYDYRENSKIAKNVVELSIDKGYTEDELNEKLTETIDKITDVNKSNLAEYVAKRKVILDILQSRLAYKDQEKKSKFKEEAIHKIICPMTTTSDDINVKDHNLWIINDSLSFYKFMASDKQIKSFLQDSDSMSRPDLTLFNGCISFLKGNDPVVIVEFKRPERDDYTDEENPISQIYNYIDEFREKKVHKADGTLIRQITNDTPFFCYVICDITDKLEKILSRENLHIPLVGKRGFFGYNSDYHAYIEIIDFQIMIDDATNRNNFFFEELGIKDD